MNKLQINYTNLLIVTLLIAANCIFAKAAIDVKRNAAATTLEENSKIPSAEEDYSDMDESIQKEAPVPLSTLWPYFEKNSTIIYVKELGQKLILYCPVKNWDDSKEIVWYNGTNAMAVAKTAVSDEYEINSNNLTSLTIRNYNDDAELRQIYCEVLPQKVRFDFMIKRVKGNVDAPSPPPEQIQASETSKTSGSMQHVDKHYYMVGLLLTAIMAIFQIV